MVELIDILYASKDFCVKKFHKITGKTTLWMTMKYVNRPDIVAVKYIDSIIIASIYWITNIDIVAI